MRFRAALAGVLMLAAVPAWADSTINLLGAGAALGGSEKIPMFQTANPAVSTTAAAIKTFTSASPTLVTPNLGTPSAGVLTSATGLPIATGVSGLGTGIATALAVNAGTAGSVVINGGVLGTPSSGTLTNLTGLPVSTGISGLGTSVATALAVNVGSAGAFAKNNGDALSGTYTGTPTFSGNLTFSGRPVLSGTLTGTQASCLGLDASNNLTSSTGACGTGGGSVSVTAGTANTVITPSPGTGTFTVGTTVPLNAQSGNAAYTIVAGDNTKAVSRTNTITQTDQIPQAGGSFPSGFAFGYSTATVGNTLKSTTSTINGIAGATGIFVPPQTEIGCNSDGTNWACMLGVPQAPTQAGTTVLFDNGFAALPAASTSTAGIAKLHNVGESVGWVATVNPNNAVIAVINQASTVSAIVGAVETATGSAATVTVNKAGSGTACSAGTALHSGSFNANGTAATNQTLTVTTSSLAAGDRLCLQTTGTTSWTGGTGIGTITVFLAPS